MENQLVLKAIFSRASTTVDGGWRITFDIDASQAQTITKLSNYRDYVLNLIIQPEPRDEFECGAV